MCYLRQSILIFSSSIFFETFFSGDLTNSMASVITVKPLRNGAEVSARF